MIKALFSLLCLYFILLFTGCNNQKVYYIESSLKTPDNWTFTKNVSLDSLHKAVSKKLKLTEEQQEALQRNFIVKQNQSIVNFYLQCKDSTTGLQYQQLLLETMINNDLFASLKAYEDSIFAVSLRMEELQKELSAVDILVTHHEKKIGKDSLTRLRQKFSELEYNYSNNYQQMMELSVRKASITSRFRIVTPPRLISKDMYPEK